LASGPDFQPTGQDRQCLAPRRGCPQTGSEQRELSFPATRLEHGGGPRVFGAAGYGRAASGGGAGGGRQTNLALAADSSCPSAAGREPVLARKPLARSRHLAGKGLGMAELTARHATLWRQCSSSQRSAVRAREGNGSGNQRSPASIRQASAQCSWNESPQSVGSGVSPAGTRRSIDSSMWLSISEISSCSFPSEMASTRAWCSATSSSGSG
jgi:hypothetical protein